jgi:hypothetical protein
VDVFFLTVAGRRHMGKPDISRRKGQAVGVSRIGMSEWRSMKKLVALIRLKFKYRSGYIFFQALEKTGILPYLEKEGVKLK